MKPETFRSLGDLQAAIMEHLWSSGPSSVVQVHEALADNRKVAYTTVFTELGRLLKKGLVKKRGRHLEVRYEAAVGRSAYLTSIMRGVLSTLTPEHRESALHGFVDAVAGTGREGLAELERVMRQKRSLKK